MGQDTLFAEAEVRKSKGSSRLAVANKAKDTLFVDRIAEQIMREIWADVKLKSKPVVVAVDDVDAKVEEIATKEKVEKRARHRKYWRWFWITDWAIVFVAILSALK